MEFGPKTTNWAVKNLCRSWLHSSSELSRGFHLQLTNEQILLRVAPSSEGCEFPPQIDKYRGIVEDAVLGCLSGAFASL
jgi:hypothetical protein